MKNALKSEYFECVCFSPEHRIVMTLDPTDGELFFETHLRTWSFWKRVFIAIKYIFGYKSKFGDFDNLSIVREEDLNRMCNLIIESKRIRHEVSLSKQKLGNQ